MPTDHDEGKRVEIPVALLSSILDELYELRGERDWWKNEPRCNYQRDYQTLCEEIKQVEQILTPRVERMRV